MVPNSNPKQKQKAETIINRVFTWVKSFIIAYWILILLVLAIYFFRLKGFIVWVIASTMLSLFFVWRARSHIKLARQQIETMIWGKPLIKELWEKGELKRKKVKIVWKKKTGVSK